VSRPPVARGAVVALVAVVLLLVAGSVLLRPGEPAADGAGDGGTTVSGTDSPARADQTPVYGPEGPAPAGGADPYIQPFAQQPGIAPQPTLAPPSGPAAPLEHVDGCDRAYGTGAQCIPRAFPPGVTDKCAWLDERGYGPLAVHGEDRQRLDRSGDGTACGPGD
jgi:hypothetical protein